MDYLKELEQKHTDIEYACLVQKKSQSFRSFSKPGILT